MKVLLVEDDKLLGESLKEYLSSEGLVVDWIEDSREFFDLLEVSCYDVIVLDLITPYIVKQLFRRYIPSPVFHQVL